MDVNTFEIPVTSEPNQTFRTTIPIDGINKTFIFNIRFNSGSGYWVMTLTDDLTNRNLVDSIPFFAGIFPAANLLEQFAYLNIGSAYVVKVNPDIVEENPNAETLGSGFKLFWSDTR